MAYIALVGFILASIQAILRPYYKNLCMSGLEYGIYIIVPICYHMVKLDTSKLECFPITRYTESLTIQPKMWKP